MIVEPGAEITTVLVEWISDHEVLGERSFNELLLADLRTGTVRKVAGIPGDGGFPHFVRVG